MLGMMCDVLSPAQNNCVLEAMKWVLWETLRGVFLLLSFFPQYLWKLYFPKFDTALLTDFLLHITLSLLGIYYHSPPYHTSHIPYPALFPFLIPLFSIGSFNVFTLPYTIKWGKVGNCGKFLYIILTLPNLVYFLLGVVG